VIPNWREEWLKFTKISGKKVIPLYGPQKKRVALMQKYTLNPDPNEAVIFITNYESLLMKDLFAELQLWKPEVVVFDESHKCKSHATARSKFAFELANPFDRKAKKRLPKPRTYLLTGTPTLNSPLDLFQQFKILDGGATFGQNFFMFRGRYFRDWNAHMPDGKKFPNWKVMTLEKDGVDAMGEMRNKIFAKASRVTKLECLDLPPEISTTIKVGMSPEQTRLYNEMKKDFLTFYNSKACVATLAITKALRLMQITSGYVSAGTPGEDEGNIEYQLSDIPKRDALKQLLDECVKEQGHKVIVWAVFRQNYKLIREVCEELGVKYVEAHGEISDSKKRANVESFKKDPEVRIFIGHPGSGGIGINLTVAPISIFYSRTFSLEHYLQARSRNHRGGAREAGHASITHFDLVCENTVDQMAAEKLVNKEEMSENLLLAEVVKSLQMDLG
jgi:SNF2 family DNA or RNA helicase